MSGILGTEDGNEQGAESGSAIGLEGSSSSVPTPGGPSSIGNFAIGVSPIEGSSAPAAPPGPPGPPTFHYFAPPPTRILSWLQLCLENDSDFRRKSLRPWIYSFSNGRLFVESLPVYGSTGLTDDFGTPITDDFGNQIQSDSPGQGGNTGTTGFPFGEGAFGETGF